MKNLPEEYLLGDIVNRKDRHLFEDAAHDRFCSCCREQIEIEYQNENPCHLCGEWRFLTIVPKSEHSLVGAGYPATKA